MTVSHVSAICGRPPPRYSETGPHRPVRRVPGHRRVSITTVALTGHGRAALGAYTQALRDLLGGL